MITGHKYLEIKGTAKSVKTTTCDQRTEGGPFNLLLGVYYKHETPASVDHPCLTNIEEVPIEWWFDDSRTIPTGH